MGMVTGKDKICREICEALGIKHGKKLDIHMAADSIMTVTAEFYPEIDGVRQFPSILEEYVVITKKELEKLKGRKEIE